MRTACAVLSGMLSLIPLATAQGPLAFDVVSVKPSSIGVDSASSDLQPGRFRGTNRTVEWMMRIAYGVQTTQISGGPSWIRSTGFDIEAKMDNSQIANMKAMEANIGPLLRQLLEDRFQLRVNRETKSAPVYSLVPAKHGAKLKLAESGSVSMHNSLEDGKMVLHASAISARDLAGFLAKQLGRPVTDNTGLTGVYDIRLEWSPEQDIGSAAGSIFAALQEQAGLKLEASKGTVETVVVDSILKPTAN